MKKPSRKWKPSPIWLLGYWAAWVFGYLLWELVRHRSIDRDIAAAALVSGAFAAALTWYSQRWRFDRKQRQSKLRA